MEKEKRSFVCDACGKTKTVDSAFFSGYGLTDSGAKHCYECCAKDDLQFMKENNRTTLYLIETKGGGMCIQNWPGSLNIPIRMYKRGGHNWGLIRTDVWFAAAGKNWHGKQIGNNSQLCHCESIK